MSLLKILTIMALCLTYGSIHAKESDGNCQQFVVQIRDAFGSDEGYTINGH